MTDADTVKVCEMLVEQVGVKPDDVAKSVYLWKPNLMTIDYPKAQEALKVMLMERANIKGAGPWLAAIIKHCNGSVPAINQQKKTDETPGCERCRFSGCIEVPHHSDWEHGRWKGLYTMVVACECPMGIWKATQIPSIRNYQAQFPQWEYEYPRRKLEMQLRDMDSKPVPTEKKAAERHVGRAARLRSELDLIDGEVAA